MQTPYSKALSAIDAAHALDPTTTTTSTSNHQPNPYELHYAQKCTHYLEQHSPSASEPLRLACRAQHFRRWEVPRTSYPMTRPGYHAWRTHLKSRQASLVADLCLTAGCSAADSERVAALIRKQDLRTDAETQVLEDVACLVFLDDQFEAFAQEHDEDKIVRIVRKTWGKMSERGRELAGGIAMGERQGELVRMAVEGGEG